MSRKAVMRRKRILLWLAAIMLCLLTLPACSTAKSVTSAVEAESDGANRASEASSASASQGASANGKPTGNEAGTGLEVVIGDKVYAATLTDTEAARHFSQQLPATFSMDDLNGNEKYHYMDSDLPASATQPGSLHAGELMLYQDDCLVLFYEDLSNSYSYTPLGTLDDPEGLAEAVGSGSVTVTFRKAAESAVRNSAAAFDLGTRSV